MINATVGILTFNSAKYLDNCLKSVKNFKEILIFDGGSNDNTLNIAKKYNCIIKKQPKKFKFKNNQIKNFSKLREYIFKISKNELVLFLDSDEILDKSTLKKIDFYSKCKKSKKKYYAFLLGRFPIHNNRVITQKTIYYPNYQPRLFYKSNVKKFIKAVHEKAIPINENLLTKKLPNISIKFKIDINDQRLFDKFKYYYEIEKSMLSKNQSFFKRISFVYFRVLITIISVVRNFIFYPKIANSDFNNYQKKLVKLNIYFSFKLVLNIFK